MNHRPPTTGLRVRALAVASSAAMALTLSASALAAAPGEVPKPPGANPGDRGWEKVTPADKGGFDVGGISYRPLVKPAESGDALAFGAMGVFAGGESGGYPSFYVTRRDGDGWSTSPLSPPSRATLITEGSRGPGRTGMVEQVDDELRWAVVESSSSLTGETPEYVPNLFMRGADGSYDLLTPGGPTSYFDAIVISNAFSSQMLTYEGVARDGGTVVFNSAVPFAPGAPAPGFSDRPGRLFESVDGEVRLVGVLPDGSVAPAARLGAGAHGTYNAVSEDGERIYFNASVNGMTGELYLRENGATVKVSDTGTFYAATRDGSKMVYRQSGSPAGVYRYDADSGTSELLSVDNEPGDGTGSALLEVLAVSDDLESVYFVGRGALVAGQPIPGPQGHLAIYLWRSGDLSYIGSLVNDRDDSTTGPGTGAYTGAVAHAWETRSYVSWTPDGQSVVFDTSAEVTGFDAGGFRQVFRYDVEDGMVCVSCPADGPATGDAVLAPPEAGSKIPRVGTYADQIRLGNVNSISDDGSRVFFSSPDALVSEDRNGRYDAYVWEDGEVGLLSDGVSEHDARFVDASADGRDVFFATRARLVASDTDDLVDIYDARVGGGFPEPESSRPSCAGGCQGPGSDGPGVRPRSSATLDGAGDASPGVRASIGLSVGKAQRGALVAGRRARVRLRVSRPGSVRLVVQARVAKRWRVAARGRAEARGAGVVSVAVRLSRPARRELARTGRLRLRLHARTLGARSALGLRLVSGKGDRR